MVRHTPRAAARRAARTCGAFAERAPRFASAVYGAPASAILRTAESTVTTARDSAALGAASADRIALVDYFDNCDSTHPSICTHDAVCVMGFADKRFGPLGSFVQNLLLLPMQQ